ncbi:hypothetical protein N431DRAFT_437737 [Stipitochalara longipes BDJ]|nr:hypothetical protein N431DRAFT_437737 [Stipitochalara longipes BDJ]
MGMPVLDPGKAGQKRYSCLYRDSLGCEKTFATSGHASRHSKIHEVDKSVSCIWPGCEKTFARRNDMQQHLVAHSRKKFRPGQRGLPNNALEDGIDFLEDSTDLRDTFPVSNAFSEPSKQTVDGAIATQILNGGDVEVLRSKSEDGASNFESKKKNTPTWEDHLATASETPGIGQDVYTGTDTSPTDPPIPNPSDASYPQLQSGVYASISEEGPEDNFEWVCHECGAGPFPAGSISACPRVDCNHLRCEECLREVEASIPFLAKKQLYSRSSSVESLQSLADSIFSIASLSSASTVAEANNAFQRVLAILKADATLKVLYADSIAKTSVDKFNRNLGRLLKRFALDLEGEAKCWNEQRAAQFIRSRARIIAQRVAGSVYPLERESQKIQPRTFEQDKAESSDDSDFEEEPDEFAELESFITNSSAFRKLHDNIRSFLGQERSYKLFEELPFAGEDHIYTLDEPVCYEQCSSPYSRNVWHLPNFSQKIRDILFPEPSIPDGMSRVRWQCSCGEALYDDYRELKPGAAKRMEDYLRRCSYKKCAGDNIRMTERMSDIGSSLKGIISSIGQRIQTLKSGERPALVNTELRYYSDTRTTRTPAHTSEDIFYLLLCHNSGIGAEIVKLRQPDICDINNDQKLFSFLHDEYITLRKRWWTWVSLWTLQSIKFVRFELYENELVDVKKVDEVPPPTKDNDYRHGPPNPPELNPPLGSTLLMHLFKHPELAGTKKHCLKKIPRKLRNRLAVVDEEDDAIGWGLQFIEGWSKKRLMYMTALTSGLSSFIVMILVSILGHDIQNAAAIASFMLSFVTIGIATAQAALHMS